MHALQMPPIGCALNARVVTIGAAIHVSFRVMPHFVPPHRVVIVAGKVTAGAFEPLLVRVLGHVRLQRVSRFEQHSADRALDSTVDFRCSVSVFHVCFQVFVVRKFEIALDTSDRVIRMEPGTLRSLFFHLLNVSRFSVCSPMVPQLFVVLERFITDGANEVLLIGMDLHVSVVQPTQDRCLEVTQLARIQFHVYRVVSPQMCMQRIPGAEVLCATLRTTGPSRIGDVTRQIVAGFMVF